ncbi:MAG TPA: sulfate ABC transporter permease subunit [Jatrophihabitans sp.]|jgi:sulfate transport system permease protein
MRAVVVLYVAVLVFVPIIVVTWRTFEDGLGAFWSAISSEQAVTAFRLTIEIAVAAVVINTVFGVGVALLISRYRFAGRRLLGALTDLSVSVSPIVVGLALILVYGPYNGIFGKSLAANGFQVIYSLPGMIMATAFVSLPLVMRSVLPVLDEEGIEQEQAAKVLGASALQRFRRITMPTIRPALAYGIVLSLARCIGEFGAVKVVSGNISGAGQTMTATLLIDERSQQLEQGTYQLAFVLILITVAAIAFVSFRRGKEKVA